MGKMHNLSMTPARLAGDQDSGQNKVSLKHNPNIKAGSSRAEKRTIRHRAVANTCACDHAAKSMSVLRHRWSRTMLSRCSCPEKLLDPADKHTHRKERGTKKERKIEPMRLRYVGYLYAQSKLSIIPKVSILPRKYIPPATQSILKIITNKIPTADMFGNDVTRRHKFRIIKQNKRGIEGV